MPKVLQQRGRCIGCNICCEVWPVRWRVSRADGKCTLVGGREKRGVWQAAISEDEVRYNERAAEACPVKIITVIK